MPAKQCGVMSVIHMLLVVEVRSLSCRDSDLFFTQAGRALCSTGRLSAALAGDEGLDEDPIPCYFRGRKEC